jgi:hypothetical protein
MPKDGYACVEDVSLNDPLINEHFGIVSRRVPNRPVRADAASVAKLSNGLISWRETVS